MNKVVFVRAHFAPVGEMRVIKVPTGEKTRGFLGSVGDVTRDEKKWVQTGFSDREIDTGRLTKDLQEAVDGLNNDGYEVVSVTQVTSGAYSFRASNDVNQSYGYGYGYSYTDGLMIVTRKV